MALIHFPSVGKWTVEIAKSKLVHLHLQHSAQRGRTGPKMDENGDRQVGGEVMCGWGDAEIYFQV